MFDHVSITVRSVEASRPFYDAVMAALGHPKVGDTKTWLGYGFRADRSFPDRIYLSILKDTDGRCSDRRHWALKATERARVDAFWQAGLDAGGRDDGPPGVRPNYHDAYYAAFLLDPDGNRIEAVCHLADTG